MFKLCNNKTARHSYTPRPHHINLRILYLHSSLHYLDLRMLMLNFIATGPYTGDCNVFATEKRETRMRAHKFSYEIVLKNVRAHSRSSFLCCKNIAIPSIPRGSVHVNPPFDIHKQAGPI